MADVYADDIEEDAGCDAPDGAFLPPGAFPRHHQAYTDADLYGSCDEQAHVTRAVSDLDFGFDSGNGDHHSLVPPECESDFQGAASHEGAMYDNTASFRRQVNACAGTISNMSLTSGGTDSAFYSEDFQCGLGNESDTTNNNNNVIDHPRQPDNHDTAGRNVVLSSLVDEDGDCLLHVAIIERREDALRTLLAARLPPNYQDSRDAWGRSALHLAVLTDQPHVIHALLAKCANPHARDACGDTPLHTACQHGLLSCVHALITHTSVQYSSAPVDANSRNYQGLTCFHLAAAHGHRDVMSYLVKKVGVDVNAGDGCSGRTVLHHAADRGDEQLVHFLLTELGDWVTVNAVAHDRRTTPLVLARGRQHARIVQALEAGGADVKISVNNLTSDSDSESDIDM